MSLVYYGNGKKLKVGDKIINGFTIGYSNLNGISPSTYDEVNRLNFKTFVYDTEKKSLFELYKNNKI
jgi:hypothetical protein